MMIRMKKILIFIVAAAWLPVSSCKEEPAALAPEIHLDNETGIYAVKEGETLVIEPSFRNAGNASYSWAIDGEVICSEPVLSFYAENSGRYYVVLTVMNEAGMDEAEIRIDVHELMPPSVSIPGSDEGFTVLQGSSMEFSPVVESSSDVSFLWSVDGRNVCESLEYVFVGEETGDYGFRFEASNEDGTTAVEFTVSVKSPDDADFSWTFEKEAYNVSKGRRILIRILDVENAFDAEYVWTVDGGKVQEGSSMEYVFNASREGVHEVMVRMRNSYIEATKKLTVNVCPEEGTYYRSGGGLPACNKVFEFLPAPGQFVNENYDASTMEQACAYAGQRLAQAQYVSLGGFGGYIVVGFDHSIDNDGGYNIAVTGNAFDGSSEPGIVWVMQDENGDGLPNDTWYELKGSEYGKAETIQDYAVTYYRPSSPAMPVAWEDNRGGSGVIDHLGSFHSQDYYYPQWIVQDSYTLRGTCLKARNYDSSGNGTYWVNPPYDWGYADNFSSVDRLVEDDNSDASAADNHFRISDAVTFDGEPAGLAYVDFVKVQTGVNSKSGWTGELSTEVFGVRDYNLEK